MYLFNSIYLIIICAILHIMETNKSHKRADREFRRFVRRHLVKPGNCRNTDQTRFYISELHKKIKEMKLLYDYIPDNAHLLFTKYHDVHDRMVFKNFQTSYATLIC